jgi:hypothetical protein
MSTDPQRTCPSCGNEFSGAMEFCPGRNWLRLPSRLDNASSFCALNLEDGRPLAAIAREIKHDFRPLRESLESRRQHQSESRVYLYIYFLFRIVSARS